MKEEQIKKKSSGSGYYNRNRGRDGYRSGGRNHGRGDSRDRKSDRYVEDAVDGMEGKCAGRKREPAMVAGNKAISGKIVECPRRMGSPEKEASGSSKDDFISTGFNDIMNKDMEEKMVFDRAEVRLDSLEGSLVEEETEICLMYEEDDRIEEKVHDTLRKHVEFWRESVA